MSMKLYCLPRRADRGRVFVVSLFTLFGSFAYFAEVSGEPVSVGKVAAATEQEEKTTAPTISAVRPPVAARRLTIPADRSNAGRAIPVRTAGVAQSDNQRSFDMSAVERIQVRVLGHGDLSGEYSVDGNMMLSLPGVGRIDIKGMTPAMVEEELARRISLFARRDLKVSIEIVNYRPYFITGVIAQPGSNEWKPGLNIIKAIALARGTIRPPSAVDDPVASLSLQQQKTRLQFSLALLARLKAERDGAVKVHNESDMAEVIATMPIAVQPRLREFMIRQSAVLGEQQQLALGQIAALERDRRTAENELRAADEQEKAAKAQLDITKSLTKNVKHLKSKNLVSNSRYLEQRSTLITAQSRYAEMQSLTARARARVISVTRQIETLKRQRRAALNTRIEALEREVAQLEVSLMPSRPTNAAGAPIERLHYNIVRETKSGMVTLDATVFSEIRPGDVVIVSRRADEPNKKKAKTAKMRSKSEAVAAERLQRAIESSAANRTIMTTTSRSGGASGGR